MNLKERIYSVLVVSASEKLNTALSSMLTESRYSPVRFVKSVSAARRALNEQDYDFVIVNSPLPDDFGTGFCVDAANTRETAVLFLVHGDYYDDVFGIVSAQGVFTLPKPLSVPLLTIALGWLESARERFRRQAQETLTFEEKMKEIRIVNRAKWILISELKMDEPQAHHYIEKQAMDQCISKRKAAEEIIRTYT